MNENFQKYFGVFVHPSVLVIYSIGFAGHWTDQPNTKNLNLHVRWLKDHKYLQSQNYLMKTKKTLSSLPKF